MLEESRSPSTLARDGEGNRSEESTAREAQVSLPGMAGRTGTQHNGCLRIKGAGRSAKKQQQQQQQQQHSSIQHAAINACHTNNIAIQQHASIQHGSGPSCPWAGLAPGVNPFFPGPYSFFFWSLFLGLSPRRAHPTIWFILHFLTKMVLFHEPCPIKHVHSAWFTCW